MRGKEKLVRTLWMGYQLLFPANKFLPIVICHGDKAQCLWENKKKILCNHVPVAQTLESLVCAGEHMQLKNCGNFLHCRFKT